MYFHITQRHSERTCAEYSPIIRDLALKGWPMPGVKIHSVWAAGHAHTWLFIVEADSYEALWRSFGPFRELSTTDILPVHNVSPGARIPKEVPAFSMAVEEHEFEVVPGLFDRYDEGLH